jgi:hypothetical protein
MLSLGYNCSFYFSSLKKTRTKNIQCHFEALQLPCLTGRSVILLPPVSDAPVLWQVRHALFVLRGYRLLEFAIQFCSHEEANILY